VARPTSFSLTRTLMSNRDSDASNIDLEDDSEDDFDWEEVEVPQQPQEDPNQEEQDTDKPLEEKHFEITIQTKATKKKDADATNKSVSLLQ
jgi:hypothetical protein